MLRLHLCDEPSCAVQDSRRLVIRFVISCLQRFAVINKGSVLPRSKDTFRLEGALISVIGKFLFPGLFFIYFNLFYFILYFN